MEQHRTASSVWFERLQRGVLTFISILLRRSEAHFNPFYVYNTIKYNSCFARRVFCTQDPQKTEWQTLYIPTFHSLCRAECSPAEAVFCDDGLSCQGGMTGYTCGEFLVALCSCSCSVYCCTVVGVLYLVVGAPSSFTERWTVFGGWSPCGSIAERPVPRQK